MKFKKLKSIFEKAVDLGIPFSELKTILTQRKIYLIRHAETDFNTEDEKIRSWVDLPLDITGLETADKTGYNLRNSGIRCIYTSDLTRAEQTAHAIQHYVSTEIECCPAFRAWNLGDLRGKATNSVKDIIQELIDNPDTLPPGGVETYNQFKARNLAEFLIQSQQSNIAILSHYSNLRLILEYLGDEDVEMKPGEAREIILQSTNQEG